MKKHHTRVKFTRKFGYNSLYKQACVQNIQKQVFKFVNNLFFARAPI